MKIILNRITKLFSKIKLLIFDVDGVLTDGRLYLTDENIEIKAFHSHDGLGIKLLLMSGIEIAVITARTSQLVSKRIDSLGIKYLYQGSFDKKIPFNDLLTRLKLNPKEIAYMGDDLTDLVIMRQCLIGIAPQNAHNYVKKYANYITKAKGGEGAVREICDLIIKSQGNYQKIYNSFL